MTFTYLAKVTLSLTVALQATSGGGRTRVTTVPQNGGLAHTVTTDRGGVYRLEALPDDTYRVDFELRGFDIVRRNHVTVVAGAPARADALLHVRPVCECISSGLSTELPPLAGQVVDDGGRPLPYARLDIVNPKRRKTAYADSEGRFVVRPPVAGMWPLTASDGGFAPVTVQISRMTAGPLVFRLAYVGSEALPQVELRNLGCLCPEFLSHETR